MPPSGFDLKYWEPDITARLDAMAGAGAISIRDINLVKTRRGKSPSSSLYVDENDGHAIVVKAGTNISRFGNILREGDYIEKNLYDEMTAVHVQDGDILVSSTGDGTLGKCAVYRGSAPAIFDGHVALIRVDPLKVHPEYLCDYLRAGFGAQQIARLFTGSTGLIELPPEALDRVFVELPNLSLQKKRSQDLRTAEEIFAGKLEEARSGLASAQSNFANN